MWKTILNRNKTVRWPFLLTIFYNKSVLLQLIIYSSISYKVYWTYLFQSQLTYYVLYLVIINILLFQIKLLYVINLDASQY